MHKAVKIISKIIFLIVFAVLLYKIAELTFKEQMIIEDNEVKVYEISQEDIISSGQEIIIKSFDEIKEVKWIDNEQLLIEGRIDDQTGRFLFDTISQELSRYTKSDEAVLDYGDYNFIVDIPGYGSLCSSGTTLGLLKDDEYFEIAENATYGDELKFIVSDDLSKLLYYHHEKEIVVTYSFEKNFYRSIKAPFSDDMVEDFDQHFQVSPIGGYVSVEYHEENLEESYFSIYGADSGRLYADKVFGTSLSWSGDDDYVCYYYTKESTASDTTIDGMDFISRRIGYYDVNHRKIDYIDSSMSELDMLSKIYWNGHTIYTLAGNVEEAIQIEKIYSYDFDENLLFESDASLEPIPYNSEVELISYDDMYILLSQGMDSHQIAKVYKDGRASENIKNLNPFDTMDDEGLFYYSHKGAFITVNNEKMTISKDGSEGYIFINDSAFITLPSEDMIHVAVWLNAKDEIKILKTK